MADEEFGGDFALGFDDIDCEFHVGLCFSLFCPSFKVEMGESALIVDLDEAIYVFIELDGVCPLPAYEFDGIGRIFLL